MHIFIWVTLCIKGSTEKLGSSYYMAKEVHERQLAGAIKMI